VNNYELRALMSAAILAGYRASPRGVADPAAAALRDASALLRQVDEEATADDFDRPARPSSELPPNLTARLEELERQVNAAAVASRSALPGATVRHMPGFYPPPSVPSREPPQVGPTARYMAGFYPPPSRDRTLLDKRYPYIAAAYANGVSVEYFGADGPREVSDAFRVYWSPTAFTDFATHADAMAALDSAVERQAPQIDAGLEPDLDAARAECLAAAAAALLDAEPTAEEIAEFRQGGACPHGERAGECSACDVAGDLAYDSARELATFGR
jgi:hypothetical protein